jgi:cation diffusion facilitator CzcD-associated flavoprotein CzcO
MARSKRRVAVIGAGPAGVIATDALAREQAFDTIRVFERRDAAGGTWSVMQTHAQESSTHVIIGF